MLKTRSGGEEDTLEGYFDEDATLYYITNILSIITVEEPRVFKQTKRWQDVSRNVNCNITRTAS